MVGHNAKKKHRYLEELRASQLLGIFRVVDLVELGDENHDPEQ